MAKNKLDKAFGPTGSSAGLFIMVVGIATTFTSLFGLILILIGAFVGLSSTSTLIDFEKRRIKFSNNLFGFIQIGKWIAVEPTMKIGITDSNVTWRSYSRGNRSLDIDEKDFRLVLFDSDSIELLHLKKTYSFESARTELEFLCNKLDLKEID